MAVVSVSMPDSLLERIDNYATEHGFTGRSEVIREAATALLGEFDEADLADRPLIGLVTVVFNFETTDVEARLMGLRHEHEGLVTSNVHTHVGGHTCLELFVLEGSQADIAGFVGQVRAVPGTQSVESDVIPIENGAD